MSERGERAGLIMREARLRMGYSQLEVATLVGIQIKQYQRFEYGHQKLSSAKMIIALRICTALELDPYRFVNDSRDMSDTDK